MTPARQRKTNAMAPVSARSVAPDIVGDDDADALLTRPTAAALLSRCWGGINVSPRSVASWPIAYKKLGHHAVYRRGDLIAFACRKLQNTPVRTGGGVAAIRRFGASPSDR